MGVAEYGLRMIEEVQGKAARTLAAMSLAETEEVFRLLRSLMPTLRHD